MEPPTAEVDASGALRASAAAPTASGPVGADETATETTSVCVGCDSVDAADARNTIGATTLPATPSVTVAPAAITKIDARRRNQLKREGRSSTSSRLSAA